MIDPSEYSALAAQAGVVWDDSNRWTRGHQARVLTVDGDAFYHPCTCQLSGSHDAYVPTPNPSLEMPPEYAPTPDPSQVSSADPPPNPADVPSTPPNTIPAPNPNTNDGNGNTL